MSALVTEIAGSIGGTTIRRSKGSFIVYNKTAGASRNILKKNEALSLLQKVRNNWNLLAEAAKKDWISTAKNVTFPNKFGKPVTITGRMLFIKSNSVLALAGNTIINPLNYSKATETFNIVEIAINTEVHTATINMDGFEDNTEIYLSAEVGIPARRNAVFNRKKTIKVIKDYHGGVINIAKQFFDNYPTIGINETVRIYATAVNRFGYRGVPVTATTITQ